MDGMSVPGLSLLLQLLVCRTDIEKEQTYIQRDQDVLLSVDIEKDLGSI